MNQLVYLKGNFDGIFLKWSSTKCTIIYWKSKLDATVGFSLTQVPIGNGQHEQKVDKLQILNSNCTYMVIGLFLTKSVSA